LQLIQRLQQKPRELGGFLGAAKLVFTFLPVDLNPVVVLMA
jgi:hypothetical protein